MLDLNHENILKMGKYSSLSLDNVNIDTIKSLYKFMYRLRLCEQSLIDEYHPADEMKCPVHFCVGQEAIPAVISNLISENDYLFSHHRSHGYFLAKKAPMKSLFAELYGKETGASGGIAGSMDLSMPSVNFYAGAILSGAIAIAVGVALSNKLNKSKNLVVAGFGEGATEEGIFWEAINYASLKKLPIIFICENNKYSTYSPQLKRQLDDNISDKVSSFGIRTDKVYGNDVISVFKTINAAIRDIRYSGGPHFIEAYTYRWNGHVGPENDDLIEYRSIKELEIWKSNDPINILEKVLMNKKIISAEFKSKMIDEIKLEINNSFKFAKNSNFPDIDNIEKLNLSTESPLADLLLKEIDNNDFDANQPDAKLAPF